MRNSDKSDFHHRGHRGSGIIRRNQGQAASSKENTKSGTSEPMRNYEENK